MLDIALLIVSIALGLSPEAPDSPAAPPERDQPAPDQPAPDQPAYVAEPQVATGRFLTAMEVKPILSATRASWVAVRDYDGQDLLYVTHLWSWRCGLVGLHIGINDAPPEPWPLPVCREDSGAPAAILEEDGLPYKAFAQGSVQRITVEVIYDDLTRDIATFERSAVLMP